VVAAAAAPAVITAGKTFRITSIGMTYLSIATAAAGRFSLKANTGGVVALASPTFQSWLVGTPAAVAGTSTNMSVTFPEGLEFAGGTGIGVAFSGVGATGAAAAGGYGAISITGYEY